ncbi:MAG: hypothetical protein ACPL5F_09925 [Moorellaceae bacterium]
MDKIAKLNPKILELSLALEEFLLTKQADGLASSTLAVYHQHVKDFLKGKSPPLHL